MSKHTIVTTCPFANEGIEVEVTFNFIKGANPTGPSYASGGEPGYPPEIELISVKPVDPALILPPDLQKDLDDWTDSWLTDNEGYGMACDRVGDDEDAARERAAELRADR
jgi:hypothetical protein